MKPEKEPDEIVLLEGMLFGGSEAIIRQEQRGQRNLVESTALPIETLQCNWEQLKAMGITPLEDMQALKEKGELFIEVNLPVGWKMVPTKHHMWSKLEDDQGRERAAIFYKAAVYDRHAHISLIHRFSYRLQPTCGYEQVGYQRYPWHCIVIDQETTIWQTEEVEPEPPRTNHTEQDDRLLHDWWRRRDNLEKQAVAWLNEHYPNWEDPTAYWD